MKTIFTVWICIIIPYCVIAQGRIDVKTDLLLSQADSLRDAGDFSEAIKVASSALDRSQKVNYFKGTADCHIMIGRSLKALDKYKEALLAYESALQIRRDILMDETSVARTYNNMASAALEMGEPKQALIYSNGAVKYCNKDSVHLLAKIYNNRANVYESLEMMDTAIQTNLLSIKLFLQTRDTITRLQTGYGLAKKLLNKSDFDKAKNEINVVLSIIHAMQYPDKEMLGRISEIYGAYFMRIPDCQPDSAIVYFQNARSIYEKSSTGDADIPFLLFNLGEAYTEKKDLFNAKDFYQKSMDAMADGNGDAMLEESVHAIIGRINAQIALEKSQKREILLRNLLILSLVIIALISLALYLNARSLLKKEKQISGQAQENTRLLEQNYQLKHDIVKNGLQAIDNHIKSEMHNLDNEDRGYSALQKMENMVSRMLNKVGYPVAGTQEPTTLKPFVRELHLQAEEIFRNAQNYSFLDGVDDYPMSKALRDQLEAIVIESFTNIYKHAECTIASLCVEVDENGLTLTIEDNGKGFNPEQVKQSGLRNIDLRVYEIKGRCKITSAPEKGSKVKIVIPGFPERPE